MSGAAFAYQAAATPASARQWLAGAACLACACGTASIEIDVVKSGVFD